MCTTKKCGFMFRKCATFLVLLLPVTGHESMSITHDGEVEISRGPIVRKVPTALAAGDITQLVRNVSMSITYDGEVEISHGPIVRKVPIALAPGEETLASAGKGNIVRRAVGSGDRYRLGCENSGCSDDGAAVCSWCGTHHGEEMVCCNKGINYNFGHNCHNANFTHYHQHECLTMTPRTACQGDPKSWDAGYGHCTTYADESGTNFKHCTTDFDSTSGKFANVVCPECGACLADFCDDDNVAVGAKATSPDGYAPSGAGGEADKATDGDPNTFWGEVKGQLGPYVVELSSPQPFAGYSLQLYITDSPMTWTLLCDGSNIDQQSLFATNAIYYKCMGRIFSCTTLRLSITAWYGTGPVIREFRLHSKQAPCSITDGSASSNKYPCICGIVSCSMGHTCTSAWNLCHKPSALPSGQTEATNTVLGDQDSNVCPSGYTYITEASTCKSAAIGHNLTYRWTFSHVQVPRGCCLDGPTGFVYFNTHSTGEKHAIGRLLCEQASTYFITTAAESACSGGVPVCSAARCATAATALGVAYDSEGTWSGSVPCCHVSRSDGKVYFNTGGSYGGSAGDYAICEAPTSSPTNAPARLQKSSPMP